MEVPSLDNKIWADLIKGDKQLEFDFLAIKIFLGTARRLYSMAPESLDKSAENLHKLFEKNKFLPTVQKDIAKLK